MERLVFIEKLVSLSESDSYYSAIDEWTYEQNFRVQTEMKETRCLCGQRIKYQFFLRNVKNGNKIVVGSCCIKKFMKNISSDKKWIKDNRLVMQLCKDDMFKNAAYGRIKPKECAIYKVFANKYNMDAIEDKEIKSLVKHIIEKKQDDLEIDLYKDEIITLNEEIDRYIEQTKRWYSDRKKLVNKCKEKIIIKNIMTNNITPVEGAFFVFNINKYEAGHLTKKQEKWFEDIKHKLDYFSIPFSYKMTDFDRASNLLEEAKNYLIEERKKYFESKK